MIVETAAGRLWVSEHNPRGARTVLLWPGLFCDGAIFEQAAASLQDCRLLTVDPPGHGRSEGQRFELDDCVKAVPAILDAFGVERAVMVGQSWGAVVALKAALAHRHRLESLVLLHPTAEADAAMPAFKNHVLHQLVRWGGLGKVARSALASTIFSEATAAPTIAAALERAAGWKSDGLAHAIRAVLLERAAFLPELSRVAMPVVVAVGSDDRAFPPACGERVAAAIPGARLVRWDRVGHMSPLEAPDAVGALVREAVRS